MRKVFNKLLLAILLLFPISVFAAGSVSVSPSSLTIEEGSSKTFTISAYNAIGDVSISSSNSGVASISTGEWGTGMVDEGQTKTGTITVTGKSVGTATITLTIDAATFDGDDLSGQTRTVTVNVVAKPTPTPTPTPTPPSNNNNNNNNSNNNNNVQTKSTNNKIKELSIDGYELVKVDANNYTLSVGPNVDSINIKATAEDSKSKVTGTGAKELQVGENNIEVVVTAENGLQNKITIKVIRKDGYYLEDLDLVLKNEKLQDADIIINADSKITKEQLNQIRDSKKTLRLNYYDENKKLIYSWIINGKEIRESKEFTTSISFATENVKEIYKLSNYADGLYVNFKHTGDLPIGTKIKLYVGDKFENGSNINVYYYNISDNKLELIKDNLKVIDGYIEFDVEHCSEYFVTMSIIENVVKQETSFNLFMIFTIVELIVIIGLVAFVFIKIKPIKKDNKKNLSNDVIDNNEEDDIINVNILN
ncbi:MAG: cadherin-like beta sandwich domain-containing protein [Bacilli bacterium]